LPVFTSGSSEKFRIAPNKVQIDTTDFRPQHHVKSALSSTHFVVNRTAVGLEGSRSLTVLTVLTVFSGKFSCDAVIRMIRVPPRPSRLKEISMPSARSEVWTRRSRPASARGDFGQPDLRTRSDGAFA
jgi:hypothetical protein